MTTVLVCGGRDYDNRDFVYACLDLLMTDPNWGPVTRVIHGNAKGADTLGSQWATSLAIRQTPFPANWNAHGKKAGPIRNQRMLEDGKPGIVVAFPGGKGTADMVRQARKAGITTWEPWPL